MSRFILIILTMLLPSVVLAKRAAPAKVEPVVQQGVRYVAPNDDGRRAYIEAWDVSTNKKQWDLIVFTNRIDPKLEEDVQWVFIKTLQVREGMLIVVSEDGKTHLVDLKLKRVTQAQRAEQSKGSSTGSTSAPSVPVPSTTVEQFYRGEHAPHWIGVILDRGTQIKLEDGSVWEIAPTDRVKTMFWSVAQKISVSRGLKPQYSFQITNTTKTEVVDAKLVKE
jgi:hypothetical protein